MWKVLFCFGGTARRLGLPVTLPSLQRAPGAARRAPPDPQLLRQQAAASQRLGRGVLRETTLARTPGEGTLTTRALINLKSRLDLT